MCGSQVILLNKMSGIESFSSKESDLFSSNVGYLLSQQYTQMSKQRAVPRKQCLQLYRADWLAWLAMLTTVGSGEGLLGGGGGLSASSISSSGSSLI